MRKLVIFGAGPIGRMLAHVFYREFQTVFVDVNQSLIETINSRREFGMSILGENTQEVTVRNIIAISGKDEKSVCSHIKDADLVLTAVGMQSIPYIAPVLARALEYRVEKRGNIPLFIVACENATEHNSSFLKEKIFENLEDSKKELITRNLFAPDCMIDRVSILPGDLELEDDPLRVNVEEYFQLCIKKTNLDFPVIPVGVNIVEDLESVKKQKLFTVNATHALIAYYGFHFGYMYIHEAIEDTRVRSLVNGVLNEIEFVLARYGIKSDDQKKFADNVLMRFKNKNLNDPILRVARDPMRKAKNGERFMMPALIALENGRSPAYLASGLSALYLYKNPEDAGSLQLTHDIEINGFENTIKQYSSLDKGSELYKLIEPPYYLGTVR